MRISADPSHPDYDPARLPADVYLDGVAVLNCVHADEEAAIVTYCLEDDNRWLILDGDDIRVATQQENVDVVPHHEHFDMWMKRRTDRAHAAYMARHAAGGIAYTRREEGIVPL